VGYGVPMTADPEVMVRDDPAKHRFEALVDGSVAGFTTYQQQGDVLAFLHTEVDDAYEGQGVGSTLVKEAIQAARARGVGVLPSCSFVASYLRRHPDLQDVVPAGERARFGLA